MNLLSFVTLTAGVMCTIVGRLKKKIVFEIISVVFYIAFIILFSRG